MLPLMAGAYLELLWVSVAFPSFTSVRACCAVTSRQVLKGQNDTQLCSRISCFPETPDCSPALHHFSHPLGHLEKPKRGSIHGKTRKMGLSQIYFVTWFHSSIYDTINGQEFGKNAVKWMEGYLRGVPHSTGSTGCTDWRLEHPGLFAVDQNSSRVARKPCRKGFLPVRSSLQQDRAGEQLQTLGSAVSCSVLLRWSSLPNRSSAAVTNTFLENETFGFPLSPHTLFFSCITLQGLDVNSPLQVRQKPFTPCLCPATRHRGANPWAWAQWKETRKDYRVLIKSVHSFSRLGRGIIPFLEILSTVEKPAPTLPFPLQLMD
ncbi:uncharacterized protein [Melopsittacus undulatus]|uniref:uncharacterized protein n=1 Tax=Melopsittacus undulatus TaxID=13146 RepID=UPI00146E425A|nr:uncharacterized protein LOC115945471 [Melopsittacus undulatus]XP_033924746.1 uncharacterized protein LOC115945471 [Melopsittacus undulatus]